MLQKELRVLHRQGIRSILLGALDMCLLATSALMTWKTLCLLTDVESPVVVVLSGSMQPAFYRGDILFLANTRQTPYEVGDIVVYNVPGQTIPIVHRIMETRNFNASVPTEQWLLTKGDNNFQDDRVGGLYGDLEWIERRHVVGKVRGFLPYVGYASILSVRPSMPLDWTVFNV
ncbi:Signal peptidase complex catalytic subunit [Ceratobasidium sp. UAMH 11750]|nr:Signal peptidase complex catalytic subunit [Ceratobasidium sp. UAMH 11750]